MSRGISELLTQPPARVAPSQGRTSTAAVLPARLPSTIAVWTNLGGLDALSSEHKARAKLVSSAAYVLVKAKELAGHAD